MEVEPSFLNLAEEVTQPDYDPCMGWPMAEEVHSRSLPVIEDIEYQQARIASLEDKIKRYKSGMPFFNGDDQLSQGYSGNCQGGIITFNNRR